MFYFLPWPQEVEADTNMGIFICKSKHKYYFYVYRTGYAPGMLFYNEIPQMQRRRTLLYEKKFN